MAATKTIHGIYDDEELLMDGAKKLRSSHISIKEVFSPFPVHGIDAVLGLERTRIAICGFIYGLTGLLLAILMTWYMMVGDWPTDVGGKPSFWYYMNWPAFIPVTFELTVFCAGHGMALTFYLRSWILPGVSPKNPDPRTTDDKFLVLLEAKPEDESKIVALLRSTGATEVNVI
ncbi:MAG TPA: DUF3341 domain-containing protein [Bacteroidia bacterium]|nr:DUF3341 domain-containing protein [Bacteroidia bacterium]